MQTRQFVMAVLVLGRLFKKENLLTRHNNSQVNSVGAQNYCQKYFFFLKIHVTEEMYVFATLLWSKVKFLLHWSHLRHFSVTRHVLSHLQSFMLLNKKTTTPTQNNFAYRKDSTDEHWFWTNTKKTTAFNTSKLTADLRTPFSIYLLWQDLIFI